MKSTNSQCRITIIKRSLQKDLIEEYLDESYQNMTLCECFEDGQQFIIENHDAIASVPQGFCPWAWADIRHEISRVFTGGRTPGMKNPATAIVGCTDWFRPVYFMIERI